MTTDLPHGWSLATLDECCTTVEKVNPRRNPDESFDYIDIGGIQPGSGRIEATKPLRGSDAPSRARQRVRAGDIILSTVRTYQRKTAIVPNSLDGAIASTGFCILRPYRGINARFIFHQLLSDGFVERLSEKQTGTSYPAVRDGDVRDMNVRLAPEMEQERIVAAVEEQFSRLDAVDAAVVSTSRRLEALRNAIIDRAFYDDAEGMRTVEIGAVAAVSGGIQKQPKRRPHENRYPFLRVANVDRGQLDLAEVHEIELFEGEIDRFRLEQGDLLVVEGNGSVNQIGRAASWEGQIEDCVHQNHLIRVRPGDELLPDYLALCWNAPHTAQQVRAVATSTSGLYTLSTSKVKSIRIPLVPLPAQRRVVELLEQQVRNIELARSASESARARVRTLRQAVLAQAFSGRLVPQSRGDESAPQLLDPIAVH